MNSEPHINIDNLRWLLDDRWGEEITDSGDKAATRLSEALAHRLHSEEELYVFSRLYTWSFDWRLVQAALEHGQCSEVVARSLYWQCAPAFLYRRVQKAQQLFDEHLVCFGFIKQIEQGISEQRWRPGTVAFSPADVFGKQLREDDVANPGIRLVPEDMKRAFPGKHLDLRAIRGLIYPSGGQNQSS